MDLRKVICLNFDRFLESSHFFFESYQSKSEINTSFERASSIKLLRC